MAESTTPTALAAYLFTDKKTAEAVQAPSSIVNPQLKQGLNERSGDAKSIASWKHVDRVRRRAQLSRAFRALTCSANVRYLNGLAIPHAVELKDIKAII